MAKDRPDKPEALIVQVAREYSDAAMEMQAAYNDLAVLTNNPALVAATDRVNQSKRAWEVAQANMRRAVQ